MVGQIDRPEMTVIFTITLAGEGLYTPRRDSDDSVLPLCTGHTSDILLALQKHPGTLVCHLLHIHSPRQTRVQIQAREGVVYNYSDFNVN